MNAASTISQLTIPEKLQVMEAIWNDLCKAGTEIAAPDWHEDELARRQQRIDDGQMKWIDWEQAKKNIREATQ